MPRRPNFSSTRPSLALLPRLSTHCRRPHVHQMYSAIGFHIEATCASGRGRSTPRRRSLHRKSNPRQIFLVRQDAYGAGTSGGGNLGDAFALSLSVMVRLSAIVSSADSFPDFSTKAGSRQRVGLLSSSCPPTSASRSPTSRSCPSSILLRRASMSRSKRLYEGEAPRLLARSRELLQSAHHAHRLLVPLVVVELHALHGFDDVGSHRVTGLRRPPLLQLRCSGPCA